MSTHNLCFEQKYEKYQNFLSENFHFLVVKFYVYLNRHVFVMRRVEMGGVEGLVMKVSIRTFFLPPKKVFIYLFFYLCFEQKYEKYQIFYLKTCCFWWRNFLYICIGVFL